MRSSKPNKRSRKWWREWGRWLALAAASGCVGGAVHNWAEGAVAWVGAAASVAGLWVALWRLRGLRARVGAAWLWALAQKAIALSFFFAATAADWLPLTPSSRWEAAALVWVMTAVAASLGFVVLGLVPGARRARYAWWGIFWAAMAFAFAEGVGALVFSLLTWAPEVGWGRMGTLGAMGYLGIEHPWGFALARAGEVWALAAALGAIGWALAVVLEEGKRLWTPSRAFARLSARAAVAVGAWALALASALVPPAALGVEGREPAVRLAVISLGEARRLSAQEYNPEALAAELALALQQAASGGVARVVLPENIPYLALARGFKEVAQAARTLPSDARLVTSATARAPDGRLRGQALVLTREGDIVALRQKVGLVPIGEYLPALFVVVARAAGFREEVSYFESTLAHLPGADVGPLALEGEERVGVVLCSEMFAPHLVRQATTGASWLANPASPSWFHGSRVYARMYSRVARTRAAALATPVAVSQIDGPALGIDSVGVVRARVWAPPGEARVAVFGQAPGETR